MDHDKYCRWMFQRVMEYVNRNKIKEAGISFVSDCHKRDIDLGFLEMMLFHQSDKYSLIKLICGYSFMPPEFQKYYDNPEQALIDYKK
jgi:hypothetical protein